MAILRSKQIKAMPEKEMEKKIHELRLELMKETKPGQGASIKTKEIKRTIARILTYLNAEKSNSAKNTVKKTVIKSKEAPKSVSKKTKDK